MVQTKDYVSADFIKANREMRNAFLNVC